MDKLPKIKWGDLEDDALMHPGCCENVGDCKVRCGHFVDGNGTEIVKSGNDVVSVPQVPPNMQEAKKSVVIFEDVKELPDGMPSLAIQEESVEQNCKVVTEITSEDLVVPIADGEMVSENDAVGIFGETYHECLNPISSDTGEVPNSSTLVTKTSLSSTIDIEMKITPQVPFDKSEDSALVISEIPVSYQVGTGEGLQDPCPDQERDAEVSATATFEDRNVSEDSLVGMNLSKNQLISVLGEDESAESKERFRQRLWCFLFENLNRAVDELYLLCELECDVEQMKEATLVLEEAASDFRELKSRVEGFDHVKRSSSQQSKDVNPLNLKTDHKRAHALSWEVRRMASSPQRAEILSSSLEAFKKIQQERANKRVAHEMKGSGSARSTHYVSTDLQRKSPLRDNVTQNSREPGMKIRKQTWAPDLGLGNSGSQKLNVEASRLSKASLVQNNQMPPQNLSASDSQVSEGHSNNGIASSAGGKGKKEPLVSTSEVEKQMPKKDRMLTESKVEKYPKSSDHLTRQGSLADKEKEKEKKNSTTWKSMDAWKEKRNWEAILASPMRSSSRVVAHSPATGRKSVERARVLHDKLMSPEKKKKTALDMKREAEEKHARAMRIRSELENERVQRLQRTSEKLNRVNEWQAVRSMKLREGMFARHQRSESRYEAHLAQVVRRAGDESSKVNEVRFITSLNEENKKLILRQKLHDSEMRRAEKLQVIRSKQKEDTAREEAVLERRKLLEAEKLQRLAETQRKKEEAQVRREEERRASSAAREAKAVEQLRRREVRAKAQQEEAELLAQKLAERLSESEQRRKVYLEQIREKASMDFRDQSSPLLRRSATKEGQVRTASMNTIEDYQSGCIPGVGDSSLGIGSAALQHPLKRRIKKVRQRLMALKYEFTEPPVGTESAGIGYRAQVGAARAKIGRWLQDLQKLRQARKEGAASIGLIVGDMIKFLEGKDSELHASRQAGLLDFIASALPASHTSKPEACQVTIYLLRLLRVVLSMPANRSYFLAQNLLPPIIPMLSTALENYINIAASVNIATNSLSSKTPVEKLESTSEVLEGFLWTVTVIIGHNCSEERQLQMRDGLMVLVIAYQIIHRLRDLFALYDRPQVEGSPFPSSILLSLNLLTILTSRSGSVSSIDWESYPSNTASGIKTQETKLVETRESMDDGIGDSAGVSALFGGEKSSSALQNMVPHIPLHESCQMYRESSINDVPEDQLVDDRCRFSGSEEPLLAVKDPGKRPNDIPNKPYNSEAAPRRSDEAVISGESDKGLMKQYPKPPLAQKDTKSTMDVSAEQNNRLQQNDDRTGRIKNENEKGVSLNQPIAFLVSAIAETGLVSLPSLLTAVLLQANSRLSSEQGSYALPSNFEEVATGVLKVLNNLALLDITLLQSMLARPDLKMEFFHLMSFLLSHCTSKWKAASDQVGLLLLESLLLLGYFALFHPGNQAVLRWGKSPTILHKVCDLPFVFFSDPELMPILAGTLVASCYGCEQSKGVVQQELSMEMLLSLLKSCKLGLVNLQSEPAAANTTAEDPYDGNQLVPESRKLQGDLPIRSNRILRNTRVVLGKGGFQGSNARVVKVRSQRDHKGTKTCDDWAIKHNLPASEASFGFMLHSRFPISFMDKAEEFFSVGSSSV